MNVKNEIDNLRKDKLGLNNHVTELALNTIIDVYKSKIINKDTINKYLSTIIVDK